MASPRGDLPPLVSLLGNSGAGKTTAAAALIAHWAARGLAVGYVKHASHGFAMDRAGKDTDRATRAGAAGVAVTGPQGLAYVTPRPEAEPVAIARRFFAGADVVVCEGFRAAGLPTVLVPDAEGLGPLLDACRGPVLAVLCAEGSGARAEAARAGLPAVAPEDVVGLARRLESALPVRVPPTA